MKRFIVLFLVVCLMTSGLVILGNTNEDNEPTRDDPGIGTRAQLNVPGTYATIQAAIDAAAASTDTVIVAAGLYPENIVIPQGKSVTIWGAGADNTSIWGGGTGTVVTVLGDTCSFLGLTINASGTAVGDAGIFIDSWLTAFLGSPEMAC